jgi:hypothetical protein
MNFRIAIDRDSLVSLKIYALEFKLNRILRLIIFAPNLARFGQNILNILISRKLAQNVYF